MSISNELSSEIAVTLLKSEALQDCKDAQQILLLAYSTLQQLSAKERHLRVRNLVKTAVPKATGATFGAS